MFSIPFVVVTDRHFVATISVDLTAGTGGSSIASVLDRHGAIDICVSNSGYGQLGAFVDLDPKVWQRHLCVDLTGAFNVTRMVAREMI
ncbi:MAG: SDR family NAD(P)-dependent oxidoreductase [Ilumatobacter sp.]|uniref:SDR family NAD(P)-dependent oxidoreductase n=1 Tax=Ilumatobacter sp. TaxID=1967498 RepID=UPI00391BC69C